ncbi:MAG: hypothetical protein AAB588_05780 [Patescibacteria group bacterium]
MCDKCAAKILDAGTTTHYISGATQPEKKKESKKISYLGKAVFNSYHWAALVAFNVAMAVEHSRLQFFIAFALLMGIFVAATKLVVEHEKQTEDDLLIECEKCHMRVEAVHDFSLGGASGTMCCNCAGDFYDFLGTNNIQVSAG